MKRDGWLCGWNVKFEVESAENGCLGKLLQMKRFQYQKKGQKYKDLT